MQHNYKELVANTLKAGQRFTKWRLASATGMSEVTARTHLQALHDEKKAFIAEWVRDPSGTHFIPAYMWGQRPDAEKPAPMPPAERTKRWREKATAQSEPAAQLTPPVVRLGLWGW